MKTAVIAGVLALLSLGAPAWAEKPEAAFQQMFREYERIRLELTNDSLEGIAERASAIAATALDAEEAAKKSPHYSPCCTAPAEIAKAADSLAAAATLVEAREAFFALSRPLIRFAEPLAPEGVVTVSCAMLDKRWLQAKGRIGNPYGGKAMAECGKVIAPEK